MIKLTRGPKPAVLTEKGEIWTDEYLRRLDGDESLPKAVLTRYRHEEIKHAVMRDAHSKCIYCESKPRAVYPGAVEHILPKSPARFPEKVVDWENLGFVCSECNRFKGDHWDEDAPILDPFVDEPDDHLLFVGPLVLARTGAIRGVVTVHELELDRRSELIERKSDHIRRLKTYLEAWQAQGDGPLKTVLKEQIEELASDKEEYTATTRSMLALEGFPC